MFNNACECVQVERELSVFQKWWKQIATDANILVKTLACALKVGKHMLRDVSTV